MDRDDARRATIRVLVQAFAPLDKVALACASGIVCGAGVFLAAAWLLIKGGAVIGPNLSLLGQFFPGFRVSWNGAFVGFLYGFLVGFATGWLVALLKNLAIARFLRKARAHESVNERRRLLDYV